MRRWAGPPPLLIAVTVLGILVAPAVSRADAGPPAIEQAVLDGAEPGPTSTPTPSTTPATTPATTPGRSGGASTRDPAPDTESDVEPEEESQPGSDATTGAAPGSRPTVPPITPQKIGVASFNQYVQLSGAAGLDDARALTSRDGVDVVGCIVGTPSRHGQRRTDHSATPMGGSCAQRPASVSTLSGLGYP